MLKIQRSSRVTRKEASPSLDLFRVSMLTGPLSPQRLDPIGTLEDVTLSSTLTEP